jgi:hypothetical protein
MVLLEWHSLEKDRLYFWRRFVSKEFEISSQTEALKILRQNEEKILDGQLNA